ncbi:MAG: response regulator [Candidatus Rokuibacteriota bacterium]
MDRGDRQLTGLRVLVVDDDSEMRASLTLVLELYGASVTAVGSSCEALQVLGESVPDVLLSDLSMPGEDGYGLIRKVRALPPDRGGRVPAAAVSARTSAEDRGRVLAAGFQLHVPKPVGGLELATVVARLGGRSARTAPSEWSRSTPARTSS